LIPVTQTHFDPFFPLQSIRKNLWVLSPIVIRVNSLGPKRLDALCCFLRGLGIGQIHAQKSNIDVVERLNFRNTLRVSGKIDAMALGSIWSGCMSVIRIRSALGRPE